MNKIKNVAILINSLSGGGAERIAGFLSKVLEEKYNVYIFLKDLNNITYDYGGIIVNLKANKCEALEESILKNKEKYKIDCSISFLQDMNYLNVRTKKNDKVIVSQRDTESFLYYKPNFLKSNTSIYYNCADKVIACSYGVKEDLVNKFNVIENKIEVIYNFIDKNKIINSSKLKINKEVELFLNKSEYFLSLGRLNKIKNHERLINEFLYFKCKLKSKSKLLILGSGEEKDNLLKIIEEKNLSSCIKIVNYIKNPFPYIKRAKALIVSSKSEGLPNVILEAMTLKTPVISTDCISGPRELLDDIRDYSVKLNEIHLGKRGILVSNNESEDNLRTHFMADAMEKIIKDKSYVEKIKVNEKQYIENYSNEEILNKWINSIEKISKKDNFEVLKIIKKEREILEKSENIFIYGAGKDAVDKFNLYNSKYKIKAFVVTNLENNKESLFNIPVIDVKTLNEKFKNPTVIIGVSIRYLGEVYEELIKHRIKNIIY